MIITRPVECGAVKLPRSETSAPATWFVPEFTRLPPSRAALASWFLGAGNRSVYRTVITAILPVGLLLLAFATSAAAQGTGTAVGIGLSFVDNSGENATGMTADVAKDFRTTGKTSIGIVGDLGYSTFELAKLLTLSAGVRVTGNVHRKVNLFGQFLVGMARFSADDCEGECSSNDPVFTPGFGVNLTVSKKIATRAQLDFPVDNFDGGSVTFKRVWFGAVFRIGR